MRERGLTVGHVITFRRVRRHAPEINKRMWPRLKISGASYRIDETYVKVGTVWKHLYSAMDSTGQTIEFMPGAKRDVPVAKRFFKKLTRAEHPRPLSKGADKHASYPGRISPSIVGMSSETVGWMGTARSSTS